MNSLRRPGATIVALVGLTVLLASCTTSSGPSAVGKKETHNCRIAALGFEQETTLRGAIEPDLTDQAGNVVPTTVDTYVTDASNSVHLYYQHGVLVGRDCGTGHVEWWSGLRGVAKLEAQRATFVEGS